MLIRLLSVAGGAGAAASVAVAAVGVGYRLSGFTPSSLEWIVVYLVVPALALVLALLTFVLVSGRIGAELRMRNGRRRSG